MKFAFDEMKLRRVDLTLLVTVDLASNAAADLASLKVGWGVSHTALKGIIEE